jgi:energy-coupling factor transport system permease protein
MRRSRPQLLALAALALLLVAGLAGCGLGAGEGGTQARVLVTRDFGARQLGARIAQDLPSSETALRLLERSFDVKTRYGGAFVQSIDGLAGGREDGRSVDWLFYVNGIESDVGAADVQLHDGDSTWWDRHDWSGTQHVPAVVGQFPEPFAHGADGKRYPVVLECADDAEDACKTVSDRLAAVGVIAGRQALGTGVGERTVRVLVGSWIDVRADPALAQIDRGPAASGVFAHFSDDARALELFDAHGDPISVLTAGAGLVAATRFEQQAPTWAVTGTDARGVAAKAIPAAHGAVMGLGRRASPLHAVRAAVGCGLCAVLALPALLFDSPPVLGAVVLAALLVGAAAGVGRALVRALLLALPFALVIALLNPLVTHNGLTVIARLGEAPVLGRVDVTLEALVYGCVLGLRALALILCCALYTAVVDPDEVLRLFRRVSFRSALTATLATRMVPVLQRDGRRMADAQRCRPGATPSRVALVRAVAAGALDRAVEVSAALEVRGYGAARRPPRVRAPWSRHDFAFALAALALVVVTVGAWLADVAAFDTYPLVHGDWGAGTWALAGALVLLPLAPFLDRHGVEPRAAALAIAWGRR